MQADNIHEVLKHYPEVTGIHPACLAVPDIAPDDRAVLESSIAARGLRHEILLTDEGLLIDGRNRLIACFNGHVEPRFRKVSGDPWAIAFDENRAHRHFEAKQKAVFGLAWVEYEKEEAKKRQIELAGTRPNTDLVETLPQGSEDKGKSRDKVGERVGVSGRSIDKVKSIAEYAPEMLADESSLEKAYSVANTRKKALNAQPVDDKVKSDDTITTAIITATGVESQIPMPKKSVFNRTNDSVDWASWTWNPVTGCEHGCKFCYAREIANSQRMAPYYPNKFEPTYHPYRLEAPKNTAKPDTDDDRDGRVFVCSMADLFGKWVPDNWIESVFNACLQSPQWKYMFLTKWPARYSQMPLIKDAWYGASVIRQADVNRVESAMQKFSQADCIRWISLEPMLEPIVFSDLSWCNLVVIGSQTSTNQPDGLVHEFAPDFDWVVDVVSQCRKFDVPYYLKANLGLERPGMNLPKGSPW